MFKLMGKKIITILRFKNLLNCPYVACVLVYRPLVPYVALWSVIGAVLSHIFFLECSGVAPGGTLIFSYIRRLGSFFGVQNFECKYFLGIFRKKLYFGGYEDFVYIFGGSSQNWTIFSGHFYAF